MKTPVVIAPKQLDSNTLREASHKAIKEAIENKLDPKHILIAFPIESVLMLCDTLEDAEWAKQSEAEAFADAEWSGEEH